MYNKIQLKPRRLNKKNEKYPWFCCLLQHSNPRKWSGLFYSCRAHTW